MVKYYFGFDLENVILVQEYVEKNYSTDDYEMHIGYGDDAMKCLEINLKEGEVELLKLIGNCKGKGRPRDVEFA